MSLKPLFDKHGCDKSKKHHYHLYYDKLFEKYDRPIKVLEIGVFKGDSTAAFLEYKPENEYYGVDIFERVSIENASKRVDGKAKFFQCNSMDVGSVLRAMKKIDTTFDIIIDDGAHWPEANRLTLDHFYPYLNEGGTYVIEDVWPFHKMSLNEMEHPWLVKHPDRYDKFAFEVFMHLIDNIKRMYDFKLEEYDLRRKSGQPDSYIMALTKP